MGNKLFRILIRQLVKGKMELNKYSKYSKYIDQLSFEYQSCVNLSGESNGFFFKQRRH